MSKKFSRRDFLKLAGVGAATTAVLSGCGPASKYVTRQQYLQMPEYNYNGQSTYYATTCRECPAGCGIVVRTMQGRALKVEGNADHPVNLGKTCVRGQATLHGLYNPDRVTGPIQRKRGSEATTKMQWDDAIKVVAAALKNNKPSEVAFLTGMAPDHLFDLVSEIAKSTGMNAPVRFGALGMFEARTTLSKAAENILGQAGTPFFDLSGAEVVFSFGANFLETWLSPVAYTRDFAKMRRSDIAKKRGYFIQFEPRMSQTGSKADEWIPVIPGTEGLVALAIGRLAAEANGGSAPNAFSSVDPADVASKSGVSLDTLKRLAGLFANASKALAIPGGAALGQSNGLAAAEAVLALNVLVDNLGKPGGVFFPPVSPYNDEYHRPASMREMQDFVKQMAAGKIKVLFIHGVNPAFELPASLGFADASKKVSQIISFATFPDETALLADYVFPDHHSLESWGYQRVAVGSGQSVLSGAQPVVTGVYKEKTNDLLFDTRATVDVLLAAIQQMGGSLVGTIPFMNEYDYVKSKLNALVGEPNGFFSAPDLPTFTAYFQQHGGWWKTVDGMTAPSASGALDQAIDTSVASFTGSGDFFLVPFVAPTLGEAGANKPWLQEIPDPTTTVMWNTWVELNPKTADKLGIGNDDVIKIVSDVGELELPVYRYPGIRPDVIAVPFGQGHTAYGQYAAGRGANPAKLISLQFNEAGDLVFAGMKVKVTKTGKKKPLSRLESLIGVYGEGLNKVP